MPLVLGIVPIVPWAAATIPYAELFEYGHAVLVDECDARGWEIPDRFFAQMHADYHAASKAALAIRLPGAALVNDLEHLFRNLKKRGGKGNGRKGTCVNRLHSFRRVSPDERTFRRVLPFDFYTNTQRLENAALVAYLQKEYFSESHDGLIAATWWCGLLSHVRAGHPASPNLVESFVSRLRRIQEMTGHRRTFVEYLEGMDNLFRQLCGTPGSEGSICGSLEHQRCVPLPANEPGQLLAIGRTVSTGAIKLKFPSVKDVLDDHEATGGASVVWRDFPREQCRYVMHRCKTKRPTGVSIDDALTLWRLCESSNPANMDVALNAAGLIEGEQKRNCIQTVDVFFARSL